MENMKLSYAKSNNYAKKFGIIGLMLVLIIFFVIQKLVSDTKIGNPIIFIIMEALILLIIIYLIYDIYEENKIKKQKLWRNGEKCLGFIIDIGYIRQTLAHSSLYGNPPYDTYRTKKVSYSDESRVHGNIISNYYITIKYHDSYSIDINSIQYNKAYVLLAMLLNPYPLKTKREIPIDVYIYKNKVYADLDSIDLSKIEEYEECVKLLEK